MGYYRIKNITDRLPKRHSRKNCILKIDYKVGFKGETYSLKAGEEIVISCGNIPTNIHMLRLKGLVTVKEISKNQFHKSKKTSVEGGVGVIESKPENKEVIAIATEDKEETRSKKSTTKSKKKSTEGNTSTSKSTVTSEDSFSD